MIDLTDRRDARSPLTGEVAAYRPFGFAESPPRWYEVREADGLRYVASARWTHLALVRPLPEARWREMLLAARHYQRVGSRTAFVGEADRPAWTRDRLLALFGSLEPWFVPGGTVCRHAS